MMKIAAFYENIKEGAQAAGLSMADAMRRLKDCGLDKIYSNYTTLRDDLPELAGILKENEIGVEGLYGFFDMAHNPDEELYKECVDLAVSVGAKNVLLLPGVVFKGEEARAEELKKNMAAGLAKAVVYAAEFGVDVTLEDFDGVEAPYNCIAGMKWFMANTEGLKCAFDTGNFVMFHEDPMEAFHAMKPFISTVHIKDRSMTQLDPGDKKKACADGSFIYPCPVGRGFIPVREIVSELKEAGYEGGLIAELYDCNPPTLIDEIGNSVKYLKSLI